MNSCREEVLLNIVGFLPCRDILRLQGVARRFRYLPCKRIHTTPFSLQITTKERGFYLNLIKVNYNNFERKFFAATSTEYGDPYVEFYSGAKGTKLILPTSQHFEFFMYLIEKLMSLFLIQEFHFCSANNEVFKRATELFKKRRYLLSEKLGVTIDINEFVICAKEREFSAEEWYFLENLRGLHHFLFFGSVLFKMDTKRFLKLPCMQTIKNMSLHIGPLSQYINPNFEFVDNAFLQSLIDRKVERFKTNTVCTVTHKFLLEYIENCLYGSYALRFLKLAVPQSPTLEADLLALGFSVQATKDSFWAKRVIDFCEKKEGQQPDTIIVTSDIFLMTSIRVN